MIEGLATYVTIPRELAIYNVNIDSQEAKLLIDYITNLQHTENLYNQLLKDYDELQQRIEKAVEYIKKQTTDEDTGRDLGYSDNIDYEYLLNILNGRSDE